MEALTAAATAALTVYDMCKALSHNIVIEEIKLMERTREAIRPLVDSVQTARLKALAIEAQLDPAFAEKWFNFVVAEVIQHHEELAGGGTADGL